MIMIIASSSANFVASSFGERGTAAPWDISQTGLTIAAILTNVAKAVRRGVVLLGPSLTRSPDAEKCL